MSEDEYDGRLHTKLCSPVPFPGVLVHDDWGTIDWDATLKDLVDAPPSADSFVWIEWLRGEALPPSSRPLLGQLIARAESWLAALKSETVLSVDRAMVEAPPPPTGRPEPIDARDSSRPDRATLDVALAMRLTPGGATREIARARQLLRMPLLKERLKSGCLSVTACNAILDQTMWLDDDACAQVDARLAGNRSLGRLTWGRATNLAKREAAAADPEGARARERERVQVADVHLDKLPGGLPGARLQTTFSEVDGAIAMAEIERLASVLHAAAKGMLSWPAARVEAHRRLILAGAAALDACPGCSQAADKAKRSSRRRAARMQVQIQVPLDTALGVSDAPGWIVGWGPVEADELRKRIYDPDLATWSRLVFDPLSGTLLDFGRTTYRPPESLRRFVVARDGGCSNPVCERTEADAPIDLDHEERWEVGGNTSASNLTAVSEPCHLARHSGGWSITHDDEAGTVTWTDRFGNAYVGHLADHRPPPTPTDEERKAWLLRLLAETPRDRRPKQSPTKANPEDETVVVTSDDNSPPPF